MKKRISKLIYVAFCIFIAFVTFFWSVPFQVDAAASTSLSSLQPAAKEMAYGNLRNLVTKYVDKPGIAKSLLAKLNVAEEARLKGNANARTRIIGAFINEVEAQTGKAVSLEHARLLIGAVRSSEIVFDQVILPFLEKAESSKGLRAIQHLELLPEGTYVQPAFMTSTDNLLRMVCKHNSFLFMIDEFPSAHFGHPVQIVLVDVETGERQSIETEWWPQINGVQIFNTAEIRRDVERTVFYRAPVLSIMSSGEFNVPAEHIESGPGAWAIIVCGFNDLSDTFHKDTNGIYNILRYLDVPDDHIYYLSPHTTHTGVDLPTSRANVAWAISLVAEQAKKEDRVLFFYSSHGGVDGLCCDGGGGGISSSDLDTWLDTITCGQMSIIIEACHSGSFIGKYANGAYFADEDELTGDGEQNRAIFTSASTDTSSCADVDGPDDPNNYDFGSETIWGYVEAFLHTSSDTSGDGKISFGEAFRYAWNNDVSRIRGWNVPQMDPSGLNVDDVYNYFPSSN